MGNSWEYAVLEWLRFNIEPVPRDSAGETKEGKEPREQTVAVFGVRYADGTEKPVYRLLHQVTTKNINDKSKTVALIDFMGMLGKSGWELVSANQEPDRMDLCTVNYLYFKRAAVEGRAVDEPKLDLDFLA